MVDQAAAGESAPSSSTPAPAPEVGAITDGTAVSNAELAAKTAAPAEASTDKPAPAPELLKGTIVGAELAAVGARRVVRLTVDVDAPGTFPGPGGKDLHLDLGWALSAPGKEISLPFEKVLVEPVIARDLR